MGPPTRSLASPSPPPSRTVSRERFFSRRRRRRSRPPPPVRTPAGLHPRPRRVGRTPLLPFPSARRRRLHQPKVASRLHMDSLKRRANEFFDKDTSTTTNETRVRRILSLLPPPPHPNPRFHRAHLPHQTRRRSDLHRPQPLGCLSPPPPDAVSVLPDGFALVPLPNRGGHHANPNGIRHRLAKGRGTHRRVGGQQEDRGDGGVKRPVD
mmetsp:Transcript_10229/g.21135  ORF Transcript_10229/g.21135 Transcript_10229/m.21135 type:complete len:209 (+) Transcript_10229:270-896(+)